jgi:hypothetical protein
MNHGSIPTRSETSVEISVNPNSKRITVTRIDMELLLNSELKKNANPKTAAR